MKKILNKWKSFLAEVRKRDPKKAHAKPKRDVAQAIKKAEAGELQDLVFMRYLGRALFEEMLPFYENNREEIQRIIEDPSLLNDLWDAHTVQWPGVRDDRPNRLAMIIKELEILEDQRIPKLKVRGSTRTRRGGPASGIRKQTFSPEELMKMYGRGPSGGSFEE